MHQRHGHQHWWPGESPFEICVGAILTQNTSWKNVEHAIANLKAARILTARKMHARLKHPERLAEKWVTRGEPTVHVNFAAEPDCPGPGHITV